MKNKELENKITNVIQKINTASSPNELLQNETIFVRFLVLILQNDVEMLKKQNTKIIKALNTITDYLEAENNKPWWKKILRL